MTQDDAAALAAHQPELDSAGTDGRTAFVAYTEVDVLRRSIHPQTDEPLETTFVVVTQIMELHFVLIAHEWRIAMAALGKDDVRTAVTALRRSVSNQRSLLASWAMLDVMSPVEYNRFREQLGQASGFQSFGYRELEFLLGVRDPKLLRPHRGMPEVHAALQQAFDEPSLLELATDCVRRSLLAAEDSTDEALADDVALWVQAYSSPNLADLAEVLAAVADHHSQWRFVHYQAVRRILGDRPGTAGSSGLTWLKRAVDSPVFAVLWDVRSRL